MTPAAQTSGGSKGLSIRQLAELSSDVEYISLSWIESASPDSRIIIERLSIDSPDNDAACSKSDMSTTSFSTEVISSNCPSPVSAQRDVLPNWSKSL